MCSEFVIHSLFIGIVGYDCVYYSFSIMCSNPKKQRKCITLQTKVEVLNKFDKGEKNVDICKAMGLTDSTVRTIRNNRTKIREMAQRSTDVSIKRVTKSRSVILEKMERLLATWIEHKNQINCPLSMAVIKTKAKSLYEDLSINNENVLIPFAASDGWFFRFKNRNALHTIKMTGEAASADTVAAEEFIIKLKNIIDGEGYLPEQVFNIDETGLYWKRMPNRTYIAEEEKTAPGFKAAKDRCTLLLGGNAAGNYKIKPLMIYNSENPRAFRGCNKENLPVIWRSNRKAWITGSIFRDYFVILEKELKTYCETKNIPFKILLLIDNAPAHPTDVDSLNDNIKVQFLPPNTTSLIQPMDQGVIATFKSYYVRRTFEKLLSAIDGTDEISIKEFWRNFNIKMAVDIIGDSWAEISPSCLNGVWKKIWPTVVTSDVNVQIAVEKETDVIADLANQVGFDVNKDDVSDLLNTPTDDLSNEELIILDERNDELITEQTAPPELSIKDLSNIFKHLDDIIAIIDEKDPDRDRSAKVTREVNNTFTCYREMLREKRKLLSQSTITNYFEKL